MALLGTNVINARDGELTIRDGTTPTALEVVVTFDIGDLAWERKQPINLIRDRGEAKGFRLGEEEVVELSFTLQYIGLKYAVNPTPYEALFGEGNASSWISRLEDLSDAFATQLDMEYTDVDGSSKELKTFDKFVCTSFKFDEAIEGGKMAVTGMALILKPTIT